MSDESAIAIADALPADIPSSPEVGQSEDGQPSSDCSGSVVIIEEIVTTSPPSSSRQAAGSVESSLGSHVMNDVMHGCAVTSAHDGDEGPVTGTPGTIARSMLRASGPGELRTGTSGASRAAAEGTEALGAEVPEAARLRVLTSSMARSPTSSLRGPSLLGLGRRHATTTTPTMATVIGAWLWLRHSREAAIATTTGSERKGGVKQMYPLRT